MSNYILLNNHLYVIDGYTSGNELYHYGVKGMKWGVRKPSSTKKPRRSESDVQYRGKSISSYRIKRLSKKEYAHVMSELMTNITSAQKKFPIITKPIGSYTYTFVNNFDDTYDVIGKQLIKTNRGKSYVKTIENKKINDLVKK